MFECCSGSYSQYINSIDCMKECYKGFPVTSNGCHLCTNIFMFSSTITIIPSHSLILRAQAQAGTALWALDLGQLLQLTGLLDAESVLEDLANVLERHALDLRVTEVDGNPAENADGGVETEGTAGRGVLHLGKEGGCDDDVGAPAGHGEHHGAHGANLHWEKLGRQPSGVAHSGTVEPDVEDHADQDDDSWTADLGTLSKRQIVVHWNPVEGDGGNNKEKTHELHRAEQNAAASNAVNEHEVNPGEEEVGSGNDGTDSDRVRKAYQCEESGRAVLRSVLRRALDAAANLLVHERVETTELGNGHETASSDQSAEVGRNDVELLQDPPLRLAGGQVLGLLNVNADVLNLLLDLEIRAVGEDAADDCLRLIRLVVVNKLTRRLWAEWEQADKEDGGERTAPNHVSPSTLDVRKGGTNAV